MQKSVRYNEGHALFLSVVARKEGTKRGYLSKKTAENSRWSEKFFALYQNVLFYFENEQSARPAGIYLLEGCTCERTPAPKISTTGKEALEKQHYFLIVFGHDGQKPLELRTDEECECDEWVEAIQQASYSDIIIEREVLMQKYIHLVQIVETEKVAANQLRTQLEDQDTEIERLKSEIVALNKTKERMRPYHVYHENEDPDIKKIKKVQSFMRGWLCRRKWKIIVQDYICSPHAESMRKRNQIVFNMVEAETEYVHQLYILVNCFLRPLRMAASSKKPPISHDDVSSIFLNSETIMFLHEIFHQGLKARIANWPTLVLADLFDILLPMLNIYQEFVRNHQYSLQVLANCKQNRDFDKLLKQYESNAACEGRMLETFLTYPMFQIPRYIITLHELLAHTPHEHVERKSLEFAKSKLEELSRVMHDEVSDTENIRKNLAIERMIVEGCDILLDTSQTFVRQGSLIQLPSVERGKLSKVRLGSLSLKKEGERQCFLFTKHFLVCTRSSGGKLHLLKQGGVLSLIDCTLIEEPDATDDESKTAGQVFGQLDFKLVVEPSDSPSFTVVLLAPSRQEKAAWTSDISQCIDNIRCNGLMTSVFEENSKVTVPHMIKSDVRLHKDDIDICFSKTLNSCKVPQIRYASVERLLERLTDLRFLSIDFLNTFLHTYRIFTTGTVVMDKLADIYKKPFSSIPIRVQSHSFDRLSISSICPDYSLKIKKIAMDQSKSLELFFATNQNNRGTDNTNDRSPRLCRKFSSPPPLSIQSRTSSPVRIRKLSLHSPITARVGGLDLTSPLSNSNFNHSSSQSAASSPTSAQTPQTPTPQTPTPTATSPPSSSTSPPPNNCKPSQDPLTPSSPDQSPIPAADGEEAPRIDPFCGKLRRSIRRTVLESVSLEKIIPESPQNSEAGDMSPCRSPSTPRHLRYRQPGVQSGENSRCSVSPASAFAIATAAAGHGTPPVFTNSERTCDKEFIIRRAATNRVLNVLRHWVSKHSQDFEMNGELKMSVIYLLEEVLRDPDLLPQERKATANILNALSQDEQEDAQLRIEDILQMADCPKAEYFESLSAMELAEQITLLDHIVFRSIPYEEFLGQGWMKVDKTERTPYIMKTSQHFNDMSNLVASQIMSHTDVGSRASSIEKWVAVADICRCLNNYNGVLEITSALNRSAIYRLKKTWAKVSKQTKALMDKLQKTVSSEGRFKNLRETLKNCNPPCVPYLGMYLTDLAFIEEGTPNFTEEGLVNFSKMRMISHIIREIRQFQQTPYRIEHQPKVTQYLMDKTLTMDEDTLYDLSLKLEPRLPA
ncbi:ras-specific guanine nucleotide-releasing factor 2 isoform X1 [Xiphophorus couchianus]|uniref:ras-specific guanine nucleotide-releasing factor 2 isoform X1 n=1 Tax=Xiphophorus couchianus TaxID=32473 RepID=UPI0010161421|nr:ras-specific guanine nucleotide-releasing factor 2 isoform X1 [Xiphophorus couchianus]